MTCQVVILRQAEQDLRELRGYLVKTFGQAVWQSSYPDIKAAILNLAAFPYSGAIPEALEQLQLVQYRQIISGSNRIIYEVRGKNGLHPPDRRLPARYEIGVDAQVIEVGGISSLEQRQLAAN